MPVSGLIPPSSTFTTPLIQEWVKRICVTNHIGIVELKSIASILSELREKDEQSMYHIRKLIRHSVGPESTQCPTPSPSQAVYPSVSIMIWHTPDQDRLMKRPSSRRKGLDNDRNCAGAGLVVRVPVKTVHCGSIGLHDGLCPELGLDGRSIVVDKLLAVDGEAERSVAYAQNLIEQVIGGININSANLSSVAQSTNGANGAGRGDGGNIPGDASGRRQSVVALSSIEDG